MIYTKLPSPGMSWKGLNWTMWLHCHTVGKVAYGPSAQLCQDYGDIDKKFWWFQIHQKRSKAHEKNPCKLRFCKCKVLISASSVWLLPQRAVSIRRIQWWNIFKSRLPPRRKWTKYHTQKRRGGTHPHPGPPKICSTFSEFFFAPNVVVSTQEKKQNKIQKAPWNCDFLWLPMATK